MNLKRLTALWLSLMMLFTLSLSFAEGETAEVPSETDENVVLATVNGTPVHKQEVDALAQDYENYYAQYGYDLSDDASQELLRQMAMDATLQFHFLQEVGASSGSSELTEEEKEQVLADAGKEYEEIISQILDYYGLTPAENASEDAVKTARESAEEIASSYGYTEETIAADMLDSAVIQKVSAYITRDVAVTEQDIQARFQELVENDRETYQDDPASYEMYTTYFGQPSYYTPEGFRGITHILLNVDEEKMKTYQELAAKLAEQETASGTEETTEAENTETEGTEKTEDAPVTQADVDAARDMVIASVQSTIDEILAKYEAGTSFEDLIQEYGQDPDMTGETLINGYPVAAGSILYEQAFTDGAFSIEKLGDISGPVLSESGVHIFKYVRDIPAGPVEFTEEIRETLKEELLSTLQGEVLNMAYDQWLAESDIVYTQAGEAYRVNLQNAPEDDAALDPDD